MGSLVDLPTQSIKMLLVGKPGTGKTGALQSILQMDPIARLFILNYDRGNISTLKNVIQFDPTTKAPRPDAQQQLSRVFYHDLGDTIKSVNGEIMVVGVPVAFSSAGAKLNDWGDGLGGLGSWTDHDWLIVDSFSAMCEAAFRYALHAGKRLNRRAQQEDYGEAIQRLSLFLEMICDEEVKANICVITHVRYVGDIEAGTNDKGQAKELEALPNALGQKLPQEIGRYFNNIIQAYTTGEGPGLQRKLYTRSPGKLELRTSNPGIVKPEYSLATGLGELVRDLRSAPVQAAAAPAPVVQPGAAIPVAASTGSVTQPVPPQA